MRAKMWACGVMAALAGCSNVDRGYEPATRGPLSAAPGQVPPGAPAAWQQPNGLSPLAYRSPAAPQPGATYGAVAATRGQPPFGAVPPATFPAAPAASPGLGYTGTGVASGFAPPAGRRVGFEDEGASGLRRVGYEQEKPLRVLDPGAFPSGGRDPLLPDVVRPPLPPAPAEAAPEPAPKRQVMRPADAPEPKDESPAPAVAHPTPRPMPPLPQAPLLVAAPEKESPEPKVATPPTPARHEERPAAPAGPNGPAVRMVNTKRIVLNYEVKDVGPSGVSTVDLWFTRDGQSWQKEANVRTGPPAVTEVAEEGMYGFTLLAKSGLGLGKKPPSRGDLPQVWVEVDLSKPHVSLADVKHGLGPKAREVTIGWSATDRNLARRPITLAYAERAEGPWVPLAANIENTGRYVWNLPASAPVSFFVRVEAADLVGNVGSAQTPRPIVIDMSQPSISILDVSPADR